MPRMALGYLFFPALRILGDVGLAVATNSEIAEALEILTALAQELAPMRPVAQNEAKRARARRRRAHAGDLRGSGDRRRRLPVEDRRGGERQAVRDRRRHSRNEPQRSRAWRAPAAAAMHAVFLRDHDESSEIARRFVVLRELIAAAAGEGQRVLGAGRGAAGAAPGAGLPRGVTSYYLAVGLGTDPWPVPVLDEMKRRLRAP